MAQPFEALYRLTFGDGDVRDIAALVLYILYRRGIWRKNRVRHNEERQRSKRDETR